MYIYDRNFRESWVGFLDLVILYIDEFVYRKYIEEREERVEDRGFGREVI